MTDDLAEAISVLKSTNTWAVDMGASPIYPKRNSPYPPPKVWHGSEDIGEYTLYREHTGRWVVSGPSVPSYRWFYDEWMARDFILKQQMKDEVERNAARAEEAAKRAAMAVSQKFIPVEKFIPVDSRGYEILNQGDIRYEIDRDVVKISQDPPAERSTVELVVEAEHDREWGYEIRHSPRWGYRVKIWWGWYQHTCWRLTKKWAHRHGVRILYREVMRMDRLAAEPEGYTSEGELS